MPARPLVLQVRVKPRSRISELVQEPGGLWTARLKSPPVDGKANAELIGLVAAHFRRPKADVTIKSGASGRTKIVRVVRAG